MIVGGSVGKWQVVGGLVVVDFNKTRLELQLRE